MENLDAVETQPPITLRPVQDEDQEFLQQVFDSTRELEIAHSPWDEAGTRNFLRQQCQAQNDHYHAYFPNTRYEIIQSHGSPVGRLYVNQRDDAILILDIALLSEHRGGGIGTSLLNDLKHEARQAGKPLRIRVEVMNPSLRLFERLGFTELPEDEIETHHLMEWNPQASEAC